MENINLTEKLSRNRKTLNNGIRAGNTLKTNLQTIRGRKFTNFQVSNVGETIRSKYELICAHNSNPSLTLNKNKRWETLEELKNDPKYFILENTPKFTKELPTTNKKSTKDDEVRDFKIIQGRKGKKIKEKRIKGKKVKKVKSERSFSDDVEFIIDVISNESVIRSMKKDPSCPFESIYNYQGNSIKNWSNYKRRENKRNCVL